MSSRVKSPSQEKAVRLQTLVSANRHAGTMSNLVSGALLQRIAGRACEICQTLVTFCKLKYLSFAAILDCD